MKKSESVLVVGSSGQIGTELVESLRNIYGTDRVIASDIRDEQVKTDGPFEVLNIMDKDALLNVVKKHNVKQVYLLAALLSATAEKNPAFGWELNMNSLFHVLDLAKEGVIDKVFWPSSIAIFGKTTPKVNTSQRTVTEPNTVYGISKFSGELWCDYYHKKYNVDVRSLRYPGLIGYKSLPGGGTTDYAVDIFHKAIAGVHYNCFLKEDTTLPMMYMADAIRCTLELMHAEPEKVQVRTSYNVAGLSFSPVEIAKEIQKHIPELTVSYKPDFRQEIANGWPQSIDDSMAREHWGWKAEFNLERMVGNMLENLRALA